MSKKTTISDHAQKGAKCISCGDLITVNYCPNCGEKKLNLHDLKVKHYVEESFEGFTHFDNKFFKSAKLLISRPGALSEKFCQGERVRYMRPFALFFVCNILFFLFSGNNIFSLPLSSFYNFWPYTEFHTQEVIDKVAPTKVVMDSVSASFNEKIRLESKAFLAILIPLLALGGLMLRGKRYLSEHLVFSTHYLAFILLYFTALDLVISKPVSFFMKEDYNEVFDTAKGLLTLLVFGCYYGIAVKRFYEISVLKAVFGSIFMTALFLTCLYGYRLLLFFKIIRIFDV